MQLNCVKPSVKELENTWKSPIIPDTPVNFNGKSSPFYRFEFYVTVNTVQVISRWVVLRGVETSKYCRLRFLFCKLPTIGKQQPTFRHKVRDLNSQPQGGGEFVITVPL